MFKLEEFRDLFISIVKKNLPIEDRTLNVSLILIKELKEKNIDIELYDLYLNEEFYDCYNFEKRKPTVTVFYEIIFKIKSILLSKESDCYVKYPSKYSNENHIFKKDYTYEEYFESEYSNVYSVSYSARKKFIDALNKLFFYSFPNILMIRRNKMKEIIKESLKKEIEIATGVANTIVDIAIILGVFKEAYNYYNYYTNNIGLDISTTFLEKLFLYGANLVVEIQSKNGEKGKVCFKDINYLYHILKSNELKFLYILDNNSKIENSIKSIYYTNWAVILYDLILLLNKDKIFLTLFERLQYLEPFENTVNTYEKLLDNDTFEFVKKLNDAFKFELDDCEIKKLKEIYSTISSIKDIVMAVINLGGCENKKESDILSKIYSFYESSYFKFIPNSNVDDINEKYNFDFHTRQSSFNNIFSEQLKEIIEEKEYEKFRKYLVKEFSDYNDDDIELYCKNYLNYLKNDEEFKTFIDNECTNYNYSSNPFNKNINDFYECIKRDKKIIKPIAYAQKRIELHKGVTGEDDYTFLVVGVIKIIERLIKMILLQKFPDNIRKSRNSKFSNPLRNIDENLELSHGAIKFQLGDAASNFSYALYSDNTSREFRETVFEIGNPKKVFEAFKITIEDNDEQRFDLHSSFYKDFVEKVRNGYFHIDQIETYEEALEKFKLTAYWMTRIIDAILTYDSNFKLRANNYSD